MTYFTDNPLERLMQQKPVGGRDTRPLKPCRKTTAAMGVPAMAGAVTASAAAT